MAESSGPFDDSLEQEPVEQNPIVQTPPASGSGSFYEADGRIADKDIAQELAQTERSLGGDAELRQEQALRNLSETGMTEEEKKNVEIMDKLLEKYPDAFETVILEDGTKMIIKGSEYYSVEHEMLSRSLFGITAYSLGFSKDGIFVFNTPRDESGHFTKGLFEVVKEARSRSVLKGEADGRLGFVIPEDLRSTDGITRLLTYNKDGLVACSQDPRVMKQFQRMFEISQSLGERRAKREKEKSVDDILGML